MDSVAIGILAFIALSLVGLVAMARRRAWNADGSDDARRKGPDALPADQDSRHPR